MSRQLRIAHLTPYYAPVIGGVEVVCQYLSEELANRGHEVHVFTGNRHHKGSLHRSMPRHEVIRGVHVHRFRSYVNVGHYGLWPGVIKPGTVLFEIGGVPEERAKVAFKRIAHKMPVKVKMVRRLPTT